MKVIVFASVFAVLVGFIRAHRRDECPSKADILMLDTDYLNKATLCLLGNGQCGKNEECCRTPSGPRCLDKDKTYEELNKDQDKDNDNDDNCDEDDENHDDKKRKSKCHDHASVNPIIITATFLALVLFSLVTLTFIRKFCSRGKIGNSRTDLNSVELRGRASAYTVQSDKKDVDRDSKLDNGQKRLSWVDTTPPPPYFMSPTAPPAYSVDPPPKYQKHNTGIENKLKY